MIVGLLTMAGVVLGLRRAMRGGGNAMDMLQYAAGYGIGFALLGYITTYALWAVLGA